MAKTTTKSFQKKSIIYSIVLMLALLIANAGFLIYNNKVLKNTKAIQQESQEIQDLLITIWNDVVRNLDLGIRGYALTQEEALLEPYYQGKNIFVQASKDLRQRLIDQNYINVKGFDKLMIKFEGYIALTDKMVDHVKNGQHDLFLELLKQDKGLELWREYEKYSNDLVSYEAQLYQESSSRYDRANSQIFIMQLFLTLIGVPTLLFVINRLIRDGRKREKLFSELASNNRQHLFNPGKEPDLIDERQIINSSIHNFQMAVNFIKGISTGNLKVDWEGLSDENKHLNQDNLSGELIKMREKMKEIKASDTKRMWVSEGLTQFSELIRKHQDDLKILGEKTVTFIVNYMQAQQGSVYLIHEDEDHKESHLELLSCYAFSKKKFIEKSIGIGEGLVGQTYLEKLPVMLTNVPAGYTEITSGLGDATPNCLLIVPMIYNEKVEAVVEIAGFIHYEQFQIEWMQKVGEIMASALISLKTTEKTKFLLEQFKEQTEQLKNQEEELKQNLEELEATQEEMKRKELDLEQRQKNLKQA